MPEQFRFEQRFGKCSNVNGDESLRIFVKIGEQLAVPVIKVLRQGEVNPTIIACAQEHQAAFIIMGASGGKVVSKWLSANVLEKSEIPVVVIPHQLRQD